MSFLLDALRKSENQKHRGDVPTIHSSSGLERRARSPLKPGLLALFLLPAILVIAWYAWQSSRQPPSQDVTPPRQQTGQQVMGAGTPAIEESMVAEPEVKPVNSLPADPPVMGRNSSVEPTQLANKNTDTARTPVETFDAPVVVTDPKAAEAMANSAQRPQTQQPFEESTLASRDTTTQAVPAEEVLESDSRGRDFREPSLDAVSYWRLPQSIREELGPLKISVLVYAEEAGSRFIIMNGRRLTEGDEPQSGLVLHEISREGAIFSYRLYRFLVSR
jgi:general secretion pathway protein B